MEVTKRYDAIVIGYGMLGTITALLLAKYRLKTLIVEQKKVDDLLVSKTGRIDGEVIDIFRHLGVWERVEKVLYGLKKYEIVNRKKKVLLTFPQVQKGNHDYAYSFYQPDVQAILQESVAASEWVDICAEHQLEVLEQDDDKSDLSIFVKCKHTHKVKLYKSHFLLCSMGRHQQLLEQFEVRYNNYGQEGYLLNIDTKTQNDLGGNKHNYRTIATNFAPITRIFQPNKHQRWEVQLEQKELHKVETTEKVRAFMDGMIPQDFEVVSSFVHRYQAQILEEWNIDNQIFVLGDAAHDMPPYLGMNLSSGIKDAYNLVWKLYYLRHQVVQNKVLDYYQGEREAAVRYLIRLNVWLRRLFRSKWLGWAGHLLPILPKSILQYSLDLSTQVKYGIIGKFSSIKGHFFKDYTIADIQQRQQLLSTSLANGFTIIALDTEPIDAVAARHIEYLAALQTQFIYIHSQTPKEIFPRYSEPLIDTQNEVRTHFKKIKAKFLIIRPDRLIYDAVATQKELRESLDLLMRKLPLKRRGEEELV